MCHLYPTKMLNFYGSFFYINYIIYPIFVQCYVMGRFGHENGSFWMLAGAVWSCFFFHWGRFGRGRFGLRGPFSTFTGAVLAMGRFGRFPWEVEAGHGQSTLELHANRLCGCRILGRHVGHIIFTGRHITA